jgi:predicted TIM-barrel fold metal-dependent hydrolase
MKVIDAHTHIGSFGSWAGLSSNAEGLLKEMDAFDVQKAILFAPDNMLVKEAVDKYADRLIGYVWPNPHLPDSVDLVKRALQQWHFRGIKLHPLLDAFLPTDEVVLPIMDVARKERAVVAIHSGHPPFSLPWSIGELAELYPDVKIVMLHMGHGHGVYIQAAINTAKKYDNIILETSGMPMHTKIKEAVEKVGEERVVFGSDYPFHHYSVELQRIKVAQLTAPQLEMVLHGNAKVLL